MNRRQAKKKERNCFRHGYYPYIKSIGKIGNALDEHNCPRNNWRKWNGLPMFRKAKKFAAEEEIL